MCEPPKSAPGRTAVAQSLVGVEDASRRLLALIAGLLAQARPPQPLPGVGLDRRPDEDLGIDSLARVEPGAHSDTACRASRSEGSRGVQGLRQRIASPWASR